jgi:hypothetical protein
MMSSLLAGRRIATSRIKPRPDPSLDAFDHGFILELDAMKVGTCSFCQFGVV